MTAATTLLKDKAIPGDDGFMLAGIDTSTRPVYSVAEVSKVFFARSPHWVRWVERKGWLVLDGEQVGTYRKPVGDDVKPGNGYRQYCLSDIEKMAHALAQHGAIDGDQLMNALRIVAAQARLYGYLPPDYDTLDRKKG